MLVPAKTRTILFIFFACLAMMAALYHVGALCYTIDATPAWRHLLFVAINLFCVYGILKRPWYFAWLFGILVLQQYYSHGLYLLRMWNEQQKLHWISLFDLLLLPILLLCLIEDRKSRKR